MKKISLLLALILAFSVFACGCSEKSGIIEDAVETLEETWEDMYNEGNLDTDGYFEIKNTRFITIKENDKELFEDVEYVVEFVIFTDYFGSAPYYWETTSNNCVLVHKDGTMTVPTANIFNRYRSLTYENDFSDIIESIEDCGDEYNCVKDLD